ncbi:secreted RxLR effector protein 161-like [Apium graveolens]|uniref:secreted RxLR effector protein 161-like n=1 Tax=Apium graveolens TaxID=4045 RepID=UPI003D7C0CC5
MGKRLTKNMDLEKGQEILHKPYAEVAESLMYAMLCTRPDLAYPVSLVSRYQSNPSQAHWEAVKRIMKYLKGTLHHKLVYREDALDIIGYYDVDLGGDKDDGKSTSGHLFILTGAAVCWGSKKQGCVVRYTQEAEYVACSMSAIHAVWIRRFLLELNLNLVNRPIEIYCDNTSTINLIYSGANSSNGQHIELQYHYIHDIVVEKEEVKVTYIPTTDMLADSLTKAILAETFIKHVSLM